MFTTRDREQILAIDSTVSAPGVDFEVILTDEDYYSSNQLVNDAFKLFYTEADYDTNDSNNNNDSDISKVRVTK